MKLRTSLTESTYGKSGEGELTRMCFSERRARHPLGPAGGCSGSQLGAGGGTSKRWAMHLGRKGHEVVRLFSAAAGWSMRITAGEKPNFSRNVPFGKLFHSVNNVVRITSTTYYSVPHYGSSFGSTSGSVDCSKVSSQVHTSNPRSIKESSADTMLASPFPLEAFEAVTWRYSQLAQLTNPIHLVELPAHE